jgi:hypothetical protein
MESRNRRAFVAQIPLDQNYIVSLFSVPRESLLIKSKKYENRARVHSIPDLKIGVFVILRAPDVIKGTMAILKDPKSAPFQDYLPENLYLS